MRGVFSSCVPVDCPQVERRSSSLAITAGVPAKDEHRIAPLSAESYKVQLTASRSLRDKIALAQDLLRHKIPSGDLAEVCDAAFTLLIESLMKKKLGMSPRVSRSPDERKIAEVRASHAAAEGELAEVPASGAAPSWNVRIRDAASLATCPTRSAVR